MASHHQPYHSCHHHPIPTSTATTTTTSSCYCCHYSSYTPSHHPLPPDPYLTSNPLHLHLHHHPPPSPPPQPHLFSPYPPQTHQPQSQPHNPHHFQDLPRHHQQHQKEEPPTQPIISSLLHRISALEASFKRRSSSSYSLRDAAARTIQTHFRAFLVHRSRTLWQLKELASIKSTLITLKSSLSQSTHIDIQPLSHKAMNLLLKLDSIQGGDPMIRDGKRSITRELNRLLEFIDGISVKRKGLSSKIVKNVRHGENNKKNKDSSIAPKRISVESVKMGRHLEEIEKLRERIDRITELNRISEEDFEEDDELENHTDLAKKSGILRNKGNIGAQVKEKRSVSFVENEGNVYRVFKSSHDSVSDEDCNSVDENEVEEIGFLSKERENKDEEDEGDGEKYTNYPLKSRDGVVRGGHDEGKDGNYVFDAPLPLKMESRAEYMNTRKL